MPGTQADPGFGVTPAKPGDAEDIARVGRDYLAAMDKRYGGNRMYAAVAYNWGPGNADKWIKGGADFSKLPAETQAYVQAVTGEAPKVSQDVAQAPKASQVVAQAPSPKTTPAADMGVGYQAALALSFLDDKDNEDDDEKAVAKLDEEEDTQAAKMLAEYKPYNALADLDLSTSRVHPANRLASGGVPFVPSVGIKGTAREELDSIKSQYDTYNTAANAYNAALNKYKAEVYDPYMAQVNAYNNAATAWNAGPRTSDFTMVVPVAPAEFSMTAPTAPTISREQYDAKAVAAKQDRDSRQLALSAASDPERFNLSMPKIFAKGGEADAEDVPTPMLFSVPTYAETVSHEMYPGQGGQFDQKDAARHMLAAGTLARKYGPNAAEILGKAHEITTSPLRWVGSKLGISQMPVDYEQDLHNNRVGIELAKRSKSQKDLEDLINIEAERARTQQTPGTAWIGKPVRRANGSPETAEEVETMEQKATQGGYGNTIPPTRSAQQLQAYMESMNPTVQVSERPMEPGLLGYVQSDKILRNMGAPNVLHINTEQSPGNAEITKLHELEHALDVRGGDIKGRPDVRYSDNTMRAYYLMDNKWGPISQTVQNMVNNKEKLEKFFGRPIESGYFHPESLKNLIAVGNETALFKEQLATLSALEQVTGKSLTRDSEMRQLFPNTRMMAVYDALTGPRQTRLDARDLPPHTPQPSYTYETNPAMRFIKQHLGPKQEYGIPVKRADGSPETGERPLTAEEIEAASKPAFLTPKSGIGRKISTKPGQIEGAVAQGVSETPYNLVGAPVDIATMAMRPFGYSVEKPVMGSDWIKEKMSAAGVRPQPPSDPTSRAFYEIGQLGGGAINPAAPVRGAVAAAEKTGEAAKMLARDFQTYNQQLAVPGASYAVRTRGGPLLYTDQRLASDWSHVNRPLDIPPGFIDPVTAFITPIADVPDKALKEWAQSKLGAYMRRDMGSPEDQFVKAADEGKRLHFMDKPDKTYTDEDVQAYIGWATRNMRDRQGFTPEGEALTKYGKMVEARIDLPIEPVSAESLLESFSAAREIPPQMLQHAKDYPYTTFYGLDVSLPGRLGLDTLVNSMYKARNSAPEFSAYGQPNVTIPERYRFTDATLQGLTPAQASERLAQSQSWFNDVRQKMASAAVKENKQLISKEYDNGSKWASFPDLAEHPDMLDMVKDVGCDGGWCTRGSDYALRYGSEEGKRLNVLFDAKARPKAQITLQTQAGTPNDFISNLTGTDYDNFLNRYPDVAKILENDAPASPWQFDAMLDDVALTPEYQAWASRQGAKITEIKGVNNTADLRKAPYLGEIHDFVKRMDKQYGLQAVDNLDGIGMVDLDSGLNMASPTWSAIFEAAGKQLPNGLVNQIIQRANTLNGGSNYAAVDEIRDLMKRATTEVLEREGHATGGMIERRIDDTRRYL